MQEHAELLVGPAAQYFRDVLMDLIAGHQRIGREQLLGAVFEAYDHALAELVASGKVIVETAPLNESHLDTLVAVAHR